MKKILVGAEALTSGGVEVSLTRFLDVLSKRKDLKVDLFLMKKEGIYFDKIPKNVNIIYLSNKHDMYKYTNTYSYIKNLHGMDKVKFFIFYFKSCLYRKLDRYDWYYKLLLKDINQVDGEYDLAIDYLGYGHLLTTVIASRVKAPKKAMWIHDEKVSWLKKVRPWTNSFDKLFCVGRACLNNVKRDNPLLGPKLDVFYNMTDYENVIKRANEKVDLKFKDNVTNIITVGRLEWQKAYDVAIEVAHILKEKKFKFNWYVIGGGTKEKELKELVKEKDLTHEFIFLGLVKNPFPIVKMADLYVLSSRHEGYCLATLEAKILNKVIIATDIESNREQITDSVNGFLCKLDPEEFANKIIQVSNDKKLMSKVKANLAKENFDYTGEFKKIDELIK